MISTTARRIARRLNYLGAGYSGGFCVFNEDGSGGYYYTAGSLPNGPIKMRVPDRRVSAREIQDMLDDEVE